VVSETLLQRTQAQTVSAFFPQFLHQFRSWSSLARATEADLEVFLRPIGLWRRRARSLLGLAREMSRRRGRFPKSIEEIESLPGVGQYIASSVLLFAHNTPRALIDVNMARVLERFFGPRQLVDIRFDPYLQDLANRVVATNDPISINWAVLDLAALVCKRDVPACSACPLSAKCRFAQGSEGQYPSAHSLR
jgi:A/G-specific adenine glycosylase